MIPTTVTYILKYNDDSTKLNCFNDSCKSILVQMFIILFLLYLFGNKILKEFFKKDNMRQIKDNFFNYCFILYEFLCNKTKDSKDKGLLSQNNNDFEQQMEKNFEEFFKQQMEKNFEELYKLCAQQDFKKEFAEFFENNKILAIFSFLLMWTIIFDIIYLMLYSIILLGYNIGLIIVNIICFNFCELIFNLLKTFFIFSSLNLILLIFIFIAFYFIVKNDLKKIIESNGLKQIIEKFREISEQEINQ